MSVDQHLLKSHILNALSWSDASAWTPKPQRIQRVFNDFRSLNRIEI
jgi:hypothetical protein